MIATILINCCSISQGVPGAYFIKTVFVLHLRWLSRIMSAQSGHKWWAGNSFSVVDVKVSLVCVLGACGWKAKDGASEHYFTNRRTY